MPSVPWDEIGTDTEIAPIPPSKYNVRCTDAELTTSKRGSVMIRCTYEITSGPQAGRTFINNVNDPTASKNVAVSSTFFNRCLVAHGLELGAYPDWADVANAFIGTEASAVLGQREYEGSIYSDVKSWAPAAAPTAAAPAGSTAPPPPPVPPS